ncbi:MAG: HAD family hydrolase [Chloroflexota bacterium]|nr:HAD family hydrolase [Chloroflexota bacterium]
MSIQYVVSDWNGTLVKYPDECELYRNLALDYAKSQLWHKIPVHPNTYLGLFQTKRKISRLQKQGKMGTGFEDYVERMYAVYNDSVTRKLSVGFVHKSVDGYAKKAVRDLDPRILEPLRQLRQEGKRMCILSAGYEYGIRSVLREGGYGDVFEPHDIVADLLAQRQGIARAFLLRIYNHKLEYLQDEFITRRKFKPNRIAYIGDGKGDEPCFDYLTAEGGYSIVSFFASDEFKQHCSEQYGAFVPQSDEDVMKYLKCNGQAS